MNKKLLIFLLILALGLSAWWVLSKDKSMGPVGEQSLSSSAGGKAEARESVQEMFENADSFIADRKLAEAKNVLQKIISDNPDFDKIEEVQQKLEGVNMEIILSNSASANNIIHQVEPGETLGKIASRYGTTVNLIKKKNNLKSDIIRAGQKLSVWKGKFNLFVDKSQNTLMLKQEEEVVKIYNVSTGENNSTPVGEFKINSKLENPVWFTKGAVVPPESPENVLGSRWLGFDTMPGYGIHGTIDPGSIGKQATAGCVRLKNSDVEELFDLIPMGTKVVVVD
ncbi:MAG: L,D-transpeptidase family protein [Candidatus Omnitrophica bacterium]|nr:L,D-transpeptidase family protein [Candidatus Omnitrophota bacterium]